MDSAAISNTMTLLIQTLAVLSGLLLFGTFLRAKVKLFQNLYLPACVIGGFIGLLLGPNVLGDYALIRMPETMLNIASNLPGLLFTPVIAALPMCSKPAEKGVLKKQRDILVLTALLCFLGASQYGLGLLTNVIFGLFGVETYRTFGLELAQGYIGGHGQAAATGNMLKQLDQPYWETAQGINVTTATVGLICGIMIGVYILNMASRKGYTKVVKASGETPPEMRVGYYAVGGEQPELGKQSTLPNAIETLTLHLAVLLLATGCGYVATAVINHFRIPILGTIATWVYALIAMYGIWFIIRKMGVDHLFNSGAKNSVTGLLSDFIIIAAIVSMPVQVILTYWAPLLVMCAAGLILTPLAAWLVGRHVLQRDGIEKALGVMGCCSGVFITGMLLIKMADPSFETEALNDYSMAYTLHNFYLVPLFATIFPFVVNFGAAVGAAVLFAQAAVFLCIILFLYKSGKRQPAN